MKTGKGSTDQNRCHRLPPKSSSMATSRTSGLFLCNSSIRPRRSSDCGNRCSFPLQSTSFSPVFSSFQTPNNVIALSSRPSRFVASAVSGSTDVEPSIVGEDTPDLLDKVEVFDLDGNAVRISDLWKDRKAVVAFARHFGCVLCRKRADYLASKKDRMDASGVTLILIGPGSVDQARTFVDQTKFKGEVYADPNHSSYDALRFVSGVLATFTPGSGLKIIQSYMEGYRQDWKLSFEKDTVSRGGWQQGGIIVAGPGKRNISYIHRDKEAGDDPDIEEVLADCCSQ